jgi:putative spermidine/putrescine transport system ATP-binding protein
VAASPASVKTQRRGPWGGFAHHETRRVCVTHDQEEALVMSDRIAIFRDGKIEQLGSGEDLYDRPVSMFVADFIGESSILRGRLERGPDGTYLVREGSGRLRIGNATLERAGLADGAAGALVVRPERLRIGGAGEPAPAGSNAVEGSVTAVLYLGSDRKYELAVSGGERAVVRQQLGGGEAEWHRGDTVTLWWPVDSGVLVADRTT